MFNSLAQQLQQQLLTVTTKPATQGIVAVRATIDFPPECQLLSWLKAQPHFPHYFWQSRDDDLTYAALGCVQSFDHLTDAEQFSQQTGLRLFGGMKFEGQCHFVLPRLVLAKKAENLTACLYLNTQQLASEAAQSRALLQQLNHFAPLASLPNHLVSQQQSTDFSHWQQRVSHALNAIKHNKFRKVVLAKATTLQFTQPICAYQLLRQSLQYNLGCYHFLWAEQAGTAFIGSSPERLYHRQGNQLTTEALAGTVAVTTDNEQTQRNGVWLLSDRKNTYENQLVADDIQQQLADCVSEFTLHPLELKPLSNVQHLRRPIQATLTPSIGDQQCLQRIHPTAAVAGLPRQHALAFIAQQEQLSRGWYAGTLGSFSPEQAEFCVALRSATITQQHITLYAGAGIVEGSDAKAEWEEIERKMLALRQFLPE